MVDAPPVDNEELRNRDLSRKPAVQLSAEEKRELKRRFEEFVTVLRRKHAGKERQLKPAPKAIKWDPRQQARKSAAN